MQLALLGLAGVEQARVFLASHKVHVTYDPEQVSIADIVAAIRAAPAAGESRDYDAVPLGGGPPTPPASQ
ncbi:MAG: heavy-metal-associated domain-containing protein [Candidatus Binatia bacterium]